MNERETAVYALNDILNEKAYNNIVLRRTFNRNSGLSAVERAFITELVNGTLRNLILIDYIINQFSKTKTEKMKPLILNILRTGVYQIMFMKKVPSSAACNEAVKLAKKKGFSTLSGFVNGVLRNISRNADSIKYPDEKSDPVKFLSVKYSYPEWIIEYWLKSYSIEEIKNMCISNNRQPKVSACVNTLRGDKETLKASLAEDNVSFCDANIEKDVIYLTKTNDITKTKAFGRGLFHIMDESSMLAVKALNPKPGDRIIDACAAPGGKSFYSAYLMENKGEILSRDIYEHKIELINGGAERLGVDIIKTELKSAEEHFDEDNETADCVLVDAPCSGFGLLRKKPDIKYTKNTGDIEELVKIQRRILESCQGYVKIGGTLVYSTCTVSEKENLENVKWFCDRFNFELDDISPFMNENIRLDTAKKGYIQILPDMFDTDGFFIARMIRKG